MKTGDIEAEKRWSAVAQLPPGRSRVEAARELVRARVTWTGPTAMAVLAWLNTAIREVHPDPGFPLPPAHFERMKRRALAKLEGPDGLRAWVAWAKKELPREYACRERYNRWQEAESNLRIAESMLAQLTIPGVL